MFEALTYVIRVLDGVETVLASLASDLNRLLLMLAILYSLQSNIWILRLRRWESWLLVVVEVVDPAHVSEPVVLVLLVRLHAVSVYQVLSNLTAVLYATVGESIASHVLIRQNQGSALVVDHLLGHL